MGLRFRMASPGLGIGYVCHTLISGLPGLGKQALSRMAAVCETTGLLTAALIEKGRRSQRQGQ